MAHLHSHILYSFNGSQKEIYSKCSLIINNYTIFSNNSTSWKTPSSNITFNNQTTKVLKKYIRHGVHCCSSTTTSSSVDQEVNLDMENLEPNKQHKFGCLVKDENWVVRRMVETEDETMTVSEVQAKAFHEPVFLFNDLFFDFFKAEVHSGLLYRLRKSPPDRYACFVAEPNVDDPNESQKEVVGVVDVTVYREKSVLQHLPGVEEYLYVSGIAVLNKFRFKPP